MYTRHIKHINNCNICKVYSNCINCCPFSLFKVEELLLFTISLKTFYVHLIFLKSHENNFVLLYYNFIFFVKFKNATVYLFSTIKYNLVIGYVIIAYFYIIEVIVHSRFLKLQYA